MGRLGWLVGRVGRRCEEWERGDMIDDGRGYGTAHGTQKKGAVYGVWA